MLHRIKDLAMFRKFSIYIIFLLFISINYLSCNILNSENYITQIEGKIYFKFWEDYENYHEQEVPKIKITLQTEMQYSHSGHDIIASSTIHGNTINIVIYGIEELDGGYEAISSAYWSDFLDLKPGKYKLMFTKHRTKINRNNSYIISIDDDIIEIKSSKQNFTEPEYQKYLRYPENSFEYICHNQLENSHICDCFIDSLKKILPIGNLKFPDEGVIPYRTASARYYKYQNDDDFFKIGEFLKNYSRDIISEHEGLSIILISWNNLYYNSRHFN